MAGRRSPLCPTRTPGGGAAADAADPGAHLGGNEGRAFHRCAGGAGVCELPALAPLAPLGTSCPDHFLRTKIKPLIVPADADAAALDSLIAGYRADYAAYYDRCKRPNSPAMRDPNAVIYLVPGVGMISFAKDKATARISAEFYVNAINVMRGASGVSAISGPARAGSLRHRILASGRGQACSGCRSRSPMQGRVAFITGGAGGIGSAIGRAAVAEGCNVVLADIDGAALDEVARGFGQALWQGHGARRPDGCDPGRAGHRGLRARRSPNTAGWMSW